MKKRLISLLIIMNLMILPVKAFALTGSVSITCSKTTLKVNEFTTCTIKGNSSEAISALETKLSADSGLTISNLEIVKSKWENGDAQNNVVTVYSENEYTGAFDIATFNVTSGSSTGTFKIYAKDNIFVDVVKYNDNSVANAEISLKVEANSSSSSKPSSGGSSSKPSSGGSSSKPSSGGSSSKPSSGGSSSKPSSASSSSKPSSGGSSSKPSSVGSSSKPSSVGSSSKPSSVGSSSKPSSASSSSTHEEPIITPSNSSNVPSGSTNIVVNPPTGNSFVLLVLLAGVGALGYTFWYRKRLSK